MLVEEEAPGSGRSSSNQVTFKPSSRSEPQRLAISATRVRPSPPSSLGAFGVAACGEPSETSTLKTLRSTLMRRPTLLGPAGPCTTLFVTSSLASSNAVCKGSSGMRRRQRRGRRARPWVQARSREGLSAVPLLPSRTFPFWSALSQLVQRETSDPARSPIVMSPLSVPSAVRSRAWASRTPPASRTLVLVALVESVGRHGRSYPHKPEIKQAGQTC